LQSFSENWPHQITIGPGKTFGEVMVWASDIADTMGVEPREIYTSFSNRIFGFKDAKLAMECKLRFG
jgi:hypothetical protein